VIDQHARYRLRPSVSIVPTKDEMIWEFFQSNTRRIRHIKVQDISLINAVINLNGEFVTDIANKFGDSGNTHNFMKYLYESCFIEDSDLAVEINKHPYNRVINFLADYFPTHEAIKAFQYIRGSHVLIVGVGAVGSWISHLMAQSGVGEFTLCDPDTVKPGNLNRSLFFFEDIGKRKTTCTARNLRNINPDISVTCLDQMIETNNNIEEVFSQSSRKYDLVINASDFPNVDTTSEIISRACMTHDVPHIIAGGYNLHLSLIGPTIIPYKTPCYMCIKEGLKKEQPDDFSNIRKLDRRKRNIGNLSPLAGISASFTIFEAIRVLVKSERLMPYMTGKRGEFNFLTSKLNYSEYARIGDCVWCGTQSGSTC